MLLQSLHDIVSDEVAFVFAQTLAQSSNELARSSESESNREPQHVPSSAHLTNENISGTEVNLVFHRHLIFRDWRARVTFSSAA